MCAYIRHKKKKVRAVCYCDECQRCSVVSSDDKTKQLLVFIVYTCESRYSGCVFYLSYLKNFLKNEQTVQPDLKIDLELKLIPGCV